MGISGGFLEANRVVSCAGPDVTSHDVDYGYKEAGAARMFKDQHDVNSLRE